ncbi:MAG TPA: hypothetical protein EYQ57_06115 [Methylococcaceae bacterium]|jgi:hypothetical protein|nr:hypothetical protein [Methylococcaceae bacterium]
MSEEEKKAPAPDEQQQDTSLKALEELTKALDEMKLENDRLSAKISAANKHTKVAERKAAAEEKATAEAAGNYEQLFKSSETERNTLSNQLAELRQTVSNKEVSNSAMKLATSIADGDNADILGDYIARRLKFVDGNVKVLDNYGNLTVSSLEDLGKEFAGSARYSALIRGNQSSGGGATGGGQNGSAYDINPFQKGTGFNLTQQAALLKSDPVKAALMRKTS